MTTPAQKDANRRNATRSTGPKTAAGKERSARNALRHGLSSLVPVIPGEKAEDWERYRSGLLDSLRPQGPLEMALADRVALCLWRLRRVAVFEAVVTALGIEQVPDAFRKNDPFDCDRPSYKGLDEILKEKDKIQERIDLWSGTLRLLRELPELPEHAPVTGDDAYGILQDILGAIPDDRAFDVEDARFLTRLGIPAAACHAPWNWNGWTAGLLRGAVALIANATGVDAERLRLCALEQRREVQKGHEIESQRLTQKARELRRRIRLAEDRLRRQRLLPDPPTLAAVMRYEAHLSRQMLQALHTLQRLQAQRSGDPVPLPAALDVIVNLDGDPQTGARDQAEGSTLG